MKFRCNQSTLTKALNIVSKAVTTKTTIPILKGILLEVSESGILKMSASDMDITIEATVEVEDCIPGSVVVQSKLFGDIIRKLPSSDINIESEGDSVTITCMNSEFTIFCSSGDEFPSIKNMENTSSIISFDKSMLKEMIRRTSFAASPDEAKGVLTGLLMEMTADELIVVGIDGFRMAVNREPVINLEEHSVIISAKLMNEINKIISESGDDENVDMIIGKSSAMFIIGNIKIVVRLLEGQFINYKDILPRDGKIEVIVSRTQLQSSIERASLLSNEGKNNLIKLAIRDNIITITSKSEEGNVKEEVLANKTGDDLDIGFNAKYVLDVLKSIDDEEIKIIFNTSITPSVVKPLEGNKFDYLILPVRISIN